MNTKIYSLRVYGDLWDLIQSNGVSVTSKPNWISVRLSDDVIADVDLIGNRISVPGVFPERTASIRAALFAYGPGHNHSTVTELIRAAVVWYARSQEGENPFTVRV